MRDYLAKAQEAATLSGEILRNSFGKITSIEEKSSPSDLVTEADRQSEALLIDFFSKHFPDHGILAEESGWGTVKDAEYVWVIDPLDGTTNYTHQYPMVAVSIGLVKNGQPILGVVYNPILEERFYAEVGGGAYLNDRKIRVSSVQTLSRGLLATGFPYDRNKNPDNNYPEFCRLTSLCQGVRRGGSAALDLSYVAAGRLDGYWERGLKPWDSAAGIAIVREAGGEVSTYTEEPFHCLTSTYLLATNGLVHQEIAKELAVARNPI